VRIMLFLALGGILATGSPAAVSRTAAYFTSSAATAASTVSTVSLQVSGLSSASAVFDVPGNMVPGDFQIKAMDIVNDGTPGVAQQDFTSSLASTSHGAGNQCSLLDSADPPTCSVPAAPSATAGSGAALLILRCTADAAATIPLDCASQNVYVTQVYPSVGAGSSQRISTAGGLSRSAVSGVATGAAYSIGIGGTSFTGGPLLIGSAYGVGGPDPVTGADGQTSGLAAGRTDHLASVVYLPTQAGDALANQTSLLTFTWTATQRLGTNRS
jgi:hypothetical protein